MKKIFSIALVAVAAMTFTSCKKDYTCECTLTSNGTVVSTTTATIHATKSDAESACSASASTNGASATCKIK